MTVARYYTPNGRSIQAKGITPDVTLPAAPSSRIPQSQANPGSSTDQLIEGDTGKPKSPLKGNRKEVDLEGHIEAADLSSTTKNLGFASDIEKWPKNLKNDYQLKMGYTYLRSWSRFAQD